MEVHKVKKVKSDPYGLLLFARAAVPWARCTFWVIWALAVSLPFYRASIQHAGEFTLPLDDAYIYLRYAVDFFSGGPFVLSGSEGMTSGSTSITYPFFPALFHMFGVSHSALPIWTFWLSAIFLGICSHAACDLARALIKHGQSKTRHIVPGKNSDTSPDYRRTLHEEITSWNTFKIASWKTRLDFLFGGYTENMAGLLAGIMVLTSPYTTWGILIGMEGGLYGAVLLGTLLVWIRNTGRSIPPAKNRIESGREPGYRFFPFYLVPGSNTKQRVLLLVLMAMLPLTRPEGILVTAMLIGLGFFSAERKTRLWTGLILFTAMVPWLFFLFLHRISTGDFSPNTAAAKSLLNEPYLDFPRYWELVKNNIEVLFQRLRGDIRHGEPLFAWPSMVLGLSLIGVVVGIKDFLGPLISRFFTTAKATFFQRTESDTSQVRPDGLNPFSGFRSPWLALSGASIVTLAGLSQNRVLYFDNHRYLLGLLLLIVVLSSCVFAVITKRFHIQAVLILAAYFAFAANKEPLKRIRQEYGVHARDIAKFQIAIGRYADQHLPEDAVIGVNDAGAIPYYARRRSLDIVGLTTNGLARPFRHGNGSLYEALEKLDPSARPTHFAIFRRYLGSTGLLGRTVFNPATSRKSGSWGNINALYEARWDHIGNDRPVPAAALRLTGDAELQLVDLVDVADLESEEEHEYSNPRPDLEWHAWRKHYSLVRYEPHSRAGPSETGIPLADGGRPVTTGESMLVKLCETGKRCYWVGRLAGFKTTNVRIRLDDRDIGSFTIQRNPVFGIFVMELTGKLEAKGRLHLIVDDVPRKEGRKVPSYVAYQHWIVSAPRKTDH